MRDSFYWMIVLPALVAVPPTVAQVSAGTPFAAEAPIPGQPLATQERERGLSALEEGAYFSAAAAFQKAAGLGDADAMRHLGDMVFAGTGVAQNYEQAIEWYCRAALADNQDAVNRLFTTNLGSWSEIRGTHGWESACAQWLKPSPPPVETEKSVAKPRKSVEIRAERQRDVYIPYLLWPRYSPGYRHHHPKPIHHEAAQSRAPIYAPNLLER